MPYSDALKFGTKDFTVSAWVKTRAGGGEGTIVGSEVCGSGAGWALEIIDGKAAFSLAGSGGLAAPLASEVKIDDGRWHQLVGRRSGTSVIVDGGLAASAEVAATYSSDGSDSLVRIGNQRRCKEHGFVGLLDEIRVLPRALTDGEMGVLRPVNLSSISIRSASGQLVNSAPRVPVVTKITTAGQLESFQFHDLGGGLVALRDGHERFLQVTLPHQLAREADQGPLEAVRASIGEREKFTWIDLGNKTFALRSLQNQKYVCQDGSAAGELLPLCSTIVASAKFRWESFQWEASPSPAIETPAPLEGYEAWTYQPEGTENPITFRIPTKAPRVKSATSLVILAGNLPTPVRVDLPGGLSLPLPVETLTFSLGAAPFVATEVSGTLSAMPSMPSWPGALGGFNPLTGGKMALTAMSGATYNGQGTEL